MPTRFTRPEVAASERAVNALCIATTGKDNPDLGRHLEYGLPELDRIHDWVGSAFPHVKSEPIEALATWRVFAGVGYMKEMAKSQRKTPLWRRSCHRGLCNSRTGVSDAPRGILFAASSTTTAHFPESTALGTHLAIEAAAQRRALNRLTEAITSEQERARDEFRATVASLAAEVREREAYAGMLATDLNERDVAMANQTAVIDSLERRLAEADMHYHNLENDRNALRERVRNLEDEKEGASIQVRALENARGIAQSQLRDLEK